MRELKQIFTFLFAIFLLQNKAIAATESRPPIATDPGVVNKMNQGEIKELNNGKYDYKKQNAPDIKEDETTKKDFYDEKAGIVVNPSFDLKKIVFVGNTRFKEKELNKYFEPLIGKTIYINDVFNTVNKINKMYYSNGYYTSYAYVPPQKIKNNTIVVNIVEGKIGEIKIEGNNHSKDNYLKNAILASNGLEEGKVFNINEVRNSLDIINSKKYIKGQIAIEEGKNQDSSDLTLNISERYPLSFNTIWDNDGNRLVGRQRGIMMLSNNNLFGLGHSIYGGTVLAKGTAAALAGYKMPVGKHGTELQFDYSYSHVNLLEEQAVNNISGKAQTFSSRIVQPLFKSDKIDLKTDLGIDFILANSMQYSTNTPISDYKLTVLRQGFNITKYDNSGLNAGRLESSFGIPILGATESTSSYFGNETTDPQSAFYKIRFDLIRLQRLPKDCFGIFRVSTQYSPNNLYPSEQIQFGGVNSIRGFQPGNCLSDIGTNGTFEIRTPLPFFKVVLPKKYEYLDKKLKLGIFYDWGVFSTQNGGVAMAGSTNLLQSVGTGLHFNITDSLVASIEVGIPIGASIYKEQGAMLHFSIKADLWDLFAKKPEIKNL
jgi:hemolysin activation/secretion protein